MARMLVKCETKSSRVKGVAFHPSLQWCLTTLHNGSIQLWDYRIGSLVDKFEEHEGPVRGIDFHSSQPLFVSGGDDFNVKLWSLSQRRCLFTFIGHLDYVRTTFFHETYPWILSASDDQTVRIWNWQSRVCLAVLTGHTHYVMCAQFHPHDDLVVSASLDQTLRVWDTSGLRQRSGGVAADFSMSAHSVLNGRSSASLNKGAAAAASDLFTATDAICKFVLEGHDRGVNWVAFHHKAPLIASAADDRLIKLWKYNSHKAWEIDTLRGHTNNVSCLVFHRQRDLLISDSEDRTIRIWDLSSRVCLHSFRREADRFWVIGAHRASGALAAGHDSGVVVFKLTTERPPAAVLGGGEVLLVRDRRICWLHSADAVGVELQAPSSCLSTDGSHQLSSLQQPDVFLAEVRRPANALAQGPSQLLVNTMNSSELQVAVLYLPCVVASSLQNDGDETSYALLCGPRGEGSASPPPVNSLTQLSSGKCLSAAFVARSKFAVLEVSGGGEKTLRISTVPSLSSAAVGAALQNVSPTEKTRSEALPSGVARIFASGSNKLLLASEDSIFTFDLPTRRLSAGQRVCVGGLPRGAIWSVDMQMVALLGKHSLMLLRCTAARDDASSAGEGKSEFKVLAAVHENIRIKGGAWDPLRGGFVYATLSHVKFVLPCGDKGIICSLIEPIYILSVQQDRLLFLDRRANLLYRAIFSDDYFFKVALNRRQYQQVALAVRYGNLCGNSLIAYLREKGHSEVALEFLSDKKPKFLMALEVGRLDDALDAARALNDPTAWKLLGEAAVQQGNFAMAETCYQKQKAFSKLAFLYFLMGARHKLRKMLHVCGMLQQPQQQLQQALLLGDVEARASVFLQQNQFALASLCCAAFGLDAQHPQLQEAVPPEELQSFLPSHAEALLPPVPIYRVEEGSRSDVWPAASSWKTSPFAEALAVVDSMPSEKARALLFCGSPDAAAVHAVQASASTAAAARGEAWGGDGADEDDGSQEEDWAEVGGASDWSDAIDLGTEEAAQTSSHTGAGVCADSAAGRGRSTAASATDALVTAGVSCEEGWRQRGTAAAMVAAGDFVGALRVLRRRLGLRRVAPLRPIFERVFQSTWSEVQLSPLTQPLAIPVLSAETAVEKSAPPQVVSVESLVAAVKEANKLVTGGKFQEALSAYREALLSMALATASSAEEEQKLFDLLDICRTYCIGLILEVERATLAESDATRNLELIAYFSCCRLQPAHAFLVLRRAMSIAWKAQNFVTAASFARRLLSGDFASLKGGAEELAKARKVLELCERRGTDALVVNFDPQEASACTVSSLLREMHEVAASTSNLLEGPLLWLQTPCCSVLQRCKDCLPEQTSQSAPFAELPRSAPFKAGPAQFAKSEKLGRGCLDYSSWQFLNRRTADTFCRSMNDTEA